MDFFGENARRPAQLLHAIVNSARYKFFILIQIEKRWIELLKGLPPSDSKAIPSLCEFLISFFMHWFSRINIQWKTVRPFLDLKEHVELCFVRR